MAGFEGKIPHAREKNVTTNIFIDFPVALCILTFPMPEISNSDIRCCRMSKGILKAKRILSQQLLSLARAIEHLVISTFSRISVYAITRTLPYHKLKRRTVVVPWNDNSKGLEIKVGIWYFTKLSQKLGKYSIEY